MQRDFLTLYNEIAIDKGKYQYNRKAINRTENTRQLPKKTKYEYMKI